MLKSRARRTRVWVTAAFVIALATTAASAGIAGAASSGKSSAKAKVDPNADKVFAYAAGPSGFDPIRGNLFPYTGAIYDRLTQIDAGLEVQPMLAESWEFAKDGSTLTFKLRDNATFTDGTPVDAAAVKANIDRARNMPFSNVRNSLTAITAVDVVNPTTVKLTLTAGQGVNLPSVFASYAGMIVNPKAITDPNVDLTPGPGAGNESGPYTLESTTLSIANGEAQFVQRPNYNKYWDQTAGRIKRLKIIGIATGAQRINAVRAGDINLGQVTGTDVPQANQLLQTGELGGQLFHQVTTLQALQMKAARPPLDNLKFRQAIQIALDKDAISQGLFSGTCEPSSQDYPKDNFWHVAALDKKTQYNEAKAKKLVQQSGVTNATLTLAYASIYEPHVQVVKDQLAKIGITVDLVPAPPSGPSFANGDFDLSWVHLIQVDPGGTMGTSYMTDSPPITPLIPKTDWPQFTPLVEKLTDPSAQPAERQKVWSQIATKLYENAYIVPVCNASQVWLTDKSIGNVENIMNTWSGLVDFRYLYGNKS